MQFEAPDESSLPFNTSEQQAFIGHLLVSEEFFGSVQGKVQPTWFNDPLAGKTFQFLTQFSSRLGRIPKSLDEFTASQEFTLGCNDMERVALSRYVGNCFRSTEVYGRDAIAANLTVWEKTQILCRNLPQIANLINSKKPNEATELFQTTSKQLLGSSYDRRETADWSDWRAIMERESFDASTALTTGLTILDRKLLPGNDRGGLLLGDTTVLIAPTNAGKTTCLATIARHNVANGENVLVVTREGRRDDFMIKAYKAFLKMDIERLRVFNKSPEGSVILDKLGRLMNQHYHYQHIPEVEAYVEDAVADIIRRHHSLRLKTGRGFSLVVIDYPALFMTRVGKNWEVRQIHDYCYRQFVQLGLQEGFHVLCAAQTNREGSKINKGLGQKRLLQFEDVSEAFGICMSATNIVTLNRDISSQANNLLTFNLVKSRSGETGWAITARSNFPCAITHSNDLGGQACLSEAFDMDSVIETLIKEYPANKSPPETLQ